LANPAVFIAFKFPFASNCPLIIANCHTFVFEDYPLGRSDLFPVGVSADLNLLARSACIVLWKTSLEGMTES
jgi:hypothetical protein